MLNLRKTIITLATLVVSAGTMNASAFSLNAIENNRAGTVSIIKVHSLHTQCLFGSVTPSGTGNPKKWHKTAEAGVHTSCPAPKRKGPGNFAPQPQRK